MCNAYYLVDNFFVIFYDGGEYFIIITKQT